VKKFKVVRMYSDDAGDTRLIEIDLPGPEFSFPGDPPSHVIRDVPATSLNIIELLEWRPRLDLHPPPRRQWVVILQGAMEISTTSGDVRRLVPGDCLLAEDMDGKGHASEDVGDDRLVTMNVGVPDDWHWPVAPR
jgi:hypothetical protein